jgi:signal transduction histidine kinase/ActR/RegA family two-component response regulator
MTAWPILSMEIKDEMDVVAVRQRARRLAELVGFETQDQTRIATAVSEIARNAYEYARRGRASFRVEVSKDKSQAFVVSIKDEGPGIADLDAILEGRYKSAHGMGVGITGAKRLVDDVQITSAANKGTLVELHKRVPKRQKAITKEALSALTARVASEAPPAEPLRMLSLQNLELVQSLEELKQRQGEVAELNRELEDTNRGVVALYGELEQKAEQLREASELKTRFLSHMSHEFRTPLNSILALADLLIKRVDGELNEEQERQVSYIKRSAESLFELVNDLLDIAKLEAGRVDIRLSTFSIGELFRGLRGLLKPLQREGVVQLVFEEPDARLPPFINDEGKITQIVRNFVANALKFTLKGEVRVSARLSDDGDRVLISVSDTGIGIADEDRERIFEEFSQIDSPTQRMVKGTGLGLSLCRRLAEVLGGEILLTSEVGKGSMFTLSVPPVLDQSVAAAETIPDIGAAVGTAEATPFKREALVLLVDDDPAFRYALRQMIQASDRAFIVEEAHDGAECLDKARNFLPDVIVLDLQMPRRDGYKVLEDLRSDPETKRIPVLISSSADIDSVVQSRIASANAFLSKRELTSQTIAAALNKILEARE